MGHPKAHPVCLSSHPHLCRPGFVNTQFFTACGEDQNEFEFHYLRSYRLHLEQEPVYDAKPKEMEDTWVRDLANYDVDDVLVLNSGAWWKEVDVYKVCLSLNPCVSPPDHCPITFSISCIRLDVSDPGPYGQGV